MAITFLSAGTEESQALNFFNTIDGTVASDTTQAHTGTRAIKCSSTATPASAGVEINTVLAASGSRISMWIYIDTLPSNYAELFRLQTNTGGACMAVCLGSDGKMFSLFGVGSHGATVLSVNTWYRISIALTITSTTVNTLKCWVNGTLQWTETNATLSSAAIDRANLGLYSSADIGASRILWLDDIYIDQDSTLTDPGDIRCTVKLPNAAGAANAFDTAVGTGTNRWDRVNERPFNTANRYTHAGTSNVSENYGIQNAATGDVDITGATIVGYMGYIYASRSSATGTSLASLTLNGTNYSIASASLTTSYKVFYQGVTSATYPSNAATIGMTSTQIAADTLFSDCGVVIAYIPSSTVSGNTNQQTTTASLFTASANGSALGAIALQALAGSILAASGKGGAVSPTTALQAAALSLLAATGRGAANAAMAMQAMTTTPQPASGTGTAIATMSMVTGTLSPQTASGAVSVFPSTNQQAVTGSAFTASGRGAANAAMAMQAVTGSAFATSGMGGAIGGTAMQTGALTTSAASGTGGGLASMNLQAGTVTAQPATGSGSTGTVSGNTNQVGVTSTPLTASGAGSAVSPSTNQQAVAGSAFAASGKGGASGLLNMAQEALTAFVGAATGTAQGLMSLLSSAVSLFTTAGIAGANGGVSMVSVTETPQPASGTGTAIAAMAMQTATVTAQPATGSTANPGTGNMGTLPLSATLQGATGSGAGRASTNQQAMTGSALGAAGSGGAMGPLGPVALAIIGMTASGAGSATGSVARYTLTGTPQPASGAGGSGGNLQAVTVAGSALGATASAGARGTMPSLVAVMSTFVVLAQTGYIPTITPNYRALQYNGGNYRAVSDITATVVSEGEPGTDHRQIPHPGPDMGRY